MERQLQLNLKSEEERVESVCAYLRPVELAPRQIAAISLIVGCGDEIQVLGQTARRWVADKQTVAETARKYGLKCSGNTFLRAVEELEQRRICGVLRNTRPWTYAVSLAALAKVEMRRADPLAALEGLACFGGQEGGDRDDSRSVSVSLGQSARARERVYQENPCPTVFRDRDRVMGDGGLTDRMLRPWDRQCGLQDGDLVQAVSSGELDPIRRLWQEAKVLEWVGGSDDDLCRFLTAVHHVATAQGLHCRMAALVSRVKRGIDVAKTRHGSEDWAAAVMRRRHALPALAVD